MKPDIPLADLICAALFALGLWNLWSAFTAGRILGHYGMVAREQDAFSFWSSVLFYSFMVILFGLILMAFLDPRDFRPVLLVMACKGSVFDCVKAQFVQVGRGR